MDDRDLENSLAKLKNEIPVNEALKRSLRPSFLTKRRSVWKKALVAVAGIAAAVCLFLLTNLAPNQAPTRAEAAALKILNQISFVDIGGGETMGVGEYGGTIYVPVAGKGLFTYDKTGLHKIISGDIKSVRVSRDGKNLAYSTGSAINLYDLNTGTSRTLLKGDQFTYYEQPTWSPDDKKLLYTKKVIEPAKTHGFSEKNAVFEIDLQSGKSRKIADGSSGSYGKDSDTVIFEKDGKILLLDIKSNKQEVIDEGRFPNASADGFYVSYVKAEHHEKALGQNAKVVEDVDNVWIADTAGLKTKKKVTFNFPNRFIAEEEWLKTLKPSKIPQNLSFGGKYSYYEPVWSSDANSLYVLKNYNAEGGSMRLMRIDLATAKLTPADTVAKYLQAVIVRDDDYAKSMMVNPPEILTLSNPHAVGYRVVKTGKEKEIDYVDAEIYSAYTAQPNYSTMKARFYLSPGDNGYIIDKVQFNEEMIFTADNNGRVIMTKGGKKELLFEEKQIPQSLSVSGAHRLASLAYNEQTETLVFTLQAIQDEGQEPYVKILSYNLDSKQFNLIDEVKEIDKKSALGVSNVVIDPTGRFAAIDLFSEQDPNFRSYCLVYDLAGKKGTNLDQLLRDTDIQAAQTKFWQQGQLVFNVQSNGQWMTYIYRPETGQVNNL